MLHRRFNELFQLRERHNFIKFALDLLLAHPQDRPAQEDVLPPRQFRMEPRPHFQQASHSPVNFRPALRRPRNPRKNFQKRGLASPITADQPQHLAFFNAQKYSSFERRNADKGDLSMRASESRSRVLSASIPRW